MKTTVVKILSTITLLLLVGFVAGFFLRSSLIEYSAKLILERQGAAQVHMAGTRINVGEIKVKHLDFVLHNGSSDLDLSFENLTLNFSMAGLVHAQVESIHLQQLRLQHTAASAAPPSQPDATSGLSQLPQLLQQLSSEWEQHLPFTSLSIANLNLAAPGIPPALQQPLSLDLRRTPDGVRFSCQTLDSTGSSATQVQLAKKAAELTLDVAITETAQMHATLHGSHLEGTFSFNPSQLKPLLAHSPALSSQALDLADSAVICASFSANVQHWPQYTMQLHLNTHHLYLNAVAINDSYVELLLQGNADAQRLHSLHTAQLNIHIPELSGPGFTLSGLQGYIELNAEDRGSYHLGAASAFKTATFTSENTSFQHAHLPLRGKLDLTQPHQLHLELNAKAPWQLTDLKHTHLNIGATTLHPGFTLKLTPTGGDIMLNHDLKIKLEELSFTDLHIPALALHPTTPAQLHVTRGENPAINLQNSPWIITLPLVKTSTMQIRPASLKLDLNRVRIGNGTLGLDADTQIQRISISTRGTSTYIRNLSLNLSTPVQQFMGTGQFNIAAFTQPVDFSLQHDPVTGRGQFRLNTPTPLHLSQEHPLDLLLTPWNFPLNAETGRVDLDLTAHWEPDTEPGAVATISLEDIAGQWQRSEFSGLNLQHQIRVWPYIESLDQAALSINLVKLAVPISEIQADMQLHQAGKTLAAPLAFELHNGQFRVLDSLFSLKPFTFRTDAATNRVLIKTDALDLSRLNPMFERNGLNMSGLVAATLPVEIMPSGVEMRNGTIRHKGPGVIIYRPEDKKLLSRAGMPEIAIRALEDFHYDYLEADVAYHPAGQLDLGVRLRGKSPRSGTTRPFHINLNIEQNILSLLESLRYSDVFDQAIKNYLEKK